jgi:Tol biopolymer transport system component
MATLRDSLAAAPRTPISSGDDSGHKRSSKRYTPTPRPRIGATSTTGSTTHGFPSSPRYWLMSPRVWRGVVWALVGWAIACSAVTGTLLAQWRMPSTIEESETTALQRWKAPAAVAHFSEAAPGVMLARLETRDWPLATAGWLDAGTGVIVLGAPSGSQGLVLCPLNPEADLAHAYFVAQPEGFGRASAVIDFGSSIKRESPMGDRLLVAFAQNGVATGGLAAVAPPPRQAAPLVVVSAPGLANVASVRSDGAAVAVVSASVGGVSGWVVAQQDIGFAGPNRTPHPLTRPGAPVTALQYSPDGTRLAYLRQPNSGDGELWIVRTDGSELDGIMLAKGSVSFGPNAFSPDGSRIAVANGKSPQERELQIHYSNASAFESAGSASSVVWHPSGDYMVVTAPGDSGKLQLWSVRSSAPYSRTPLTQLSTGVQPICRISPDGTRALTIADGTENLTAVFVNLQRAR